MILLIVVVVGLALGSFINALVYRLHAQSSPKPKKLAKKDLSIIKGRSLCPNCYHLLSPLDLIPVFSWIALRGKCRYCKKPISWQYPAVELLTSALFALSYLYWPYLFNSENYLLLIIWLLILTLFIALAIYDFKWKLLPDKLVLSLVILTFTQVVLKLIFFGGGLNLVFASLWGILLSAGVFYVLYTVSKGTWIGGGDIKLSIGLGLLVGGPAEAILMLFLASTIGTLVSLPFLITHKLKKSSVIPFGPFLIIAATICYFFGTNIVNWYQTLIVK